MRPGSTPAQFAVRDNVTGPGFRPTPLSHFPAFSATACLAVLLIPAFSSAVEPDDGPQTRFSLPHVEAQLVVRPASGIAANTITTLLTGFDATILQSSPTSGLHVIGIDSDANLAAAAALLLADSRIALAEPNFIFTTSATPNDLDFPLQWSKDNTGINSPSGLGAPDADMNMTEAWDLRTTADEIIIAIIDDSLETTHTDLVGNVLLSGRCFASPNSQRPCTNGSDDPNPTGPDDFHGTLVAGAAAARGNNGIGIAGVVWEASILPLKVDLTSFAIVEAVDEAIAQDARIINMSFGGPVESAAQREAIGRARDAGILVVASAGNSDANNRTASSYPADTALDNVITVAASTDSDRIAAFSQWGSFDVDIAAPGELIRTTANDNDYGVVSGTSFAAPHVAGIAALIDAHTGAAGYLTARAHLLHGGVDGVGIVGPTVPGQDPEAIPGRVATGRIDAARALTGPTGGVLIIEDVTIDDAAVGNGNGMLEPGETADLNVTIGNAWVTETGVVGSLESPDSMLITVNDLTPVPFGDVAEGETATAGFSVTLSANATGNQQIFFTLAPSSATSGSMPPRHFYLEVGSLVSGVTLNQAIQRWDWDEFQTFAIDVPIGSTSLDISATAAADIDLLVRFDAPPEYLISLGGGNFYYVDPETSTSGGPGGNEHIVYSSPLPGTYYVTVVNYDRAARSYDITAQVSDASTNSIRFESGNLSVEESASEVVLTVIRTGNVGAATVDFQTVADTASDGDDYSGVTGQLTWAVGESGPKTITVPILPDAIDEDTETFSVTLTNVTGSDPGIPSLATVQIRDDDDGADPGSGSGGSGGGSAGGGASRTGSGGGAIGWPALPALLLLVAGRALRRRQAG